MAIQVKYTAEVLKVGKKYTWSVRTKKWFVQSRHHFTSKTPTVASMIRVIESIWGHHRVVYKYTKM